MEEGPHFQVGEMIEIHHRFKKRWEWDHGMIRNKNSEGCYDIRTLTNTYWNVSKESIRHLENERIQEKLNRWHTPMTVKDFKAKLRKLKMKDKVR
mmetsp:Transcript_14805/g.19533  ORF Transcript_14805/g.19533 Transcript_14805/m.19533 type:complete len:95 (+) Transcript_14805:1-285(+)